MLNSLKNTFRRILHLKLYLKDPKKPMIRKIMIVFGIIYLLSPVDLLPEPVFGIGMIDDLVLWGMILSYLSEELDSYTGEEGISGEARKKYGKTRIYEAEARVVEEEDDPMEGE